MNARIGCVCVGMEWHRVRWASSPTGGLPLTTGGGDEEKKNQKDRSRPRDQARDHRQTRLYCKAAETPSGGFPSVAATAGALFPFASASPNARLGRADLRQRTATL